METAVMKDWCSFENGIYPVRVLYYVGNRKGMCGGVHFALTSPQVMKEKMEATSAALFAKKWNECFGEDDKSSDSECLSVEVEGYGRMWIVRIGSFDGSTYDTSVVSHECLHAALSILGFCGVSEEPPFEALCYLHEAIFKQAIDFVFGRIGMLRKDRNDVPRKDV